jgi:hypothetical protein
VAVLVGAAVKVIVLAPPTHKLEEDTDAVIGSGMLTEVVTAALFTLSQFASKEETYHVVVAAIEDVKLGLAPVCNTVVEVGEAYQLYPVEPDTDDVGTPTPH